ncbi:hypothetical protein BCV70DRAFT_203080 [Testicularia cyperi]|uniref:Uncharacterized protein n=1 Tax=Testicularia cyperi TaxID=1882483 RepID=A0A317XGH0_9BASI|nr:hypothetical protein BCV70DRAFT_203080 [Testicularia cyperi]
MSEIKLASSAGFGEVMTVCHGHCRKLCGSARTRQPLSTMLPRRPLRVEQIVHYRVSRSGKHRQVQYCIRVTRSAATQRKYERRSRDGCGCR